MGEGKGNGRGGGNLAPQSFLKVDTYAFLYAVILL